MPLLMELPPPAFPARGSSSSLLLVFFFCREVRAALGMGLFGFCAWCLEGSVRSTCPTASAVPSLSLLGSLVGFGGCEMTWGG